MSLINNTQGIAAASDPETVGVPQLFAGDQPPVATRDVFIPAANSAIAQYTPLTYSDVNGYTPFAGLALLTKQYAGAGNGAMSGLALGSAPVAETITVSLKTVAANGGVFSVVGSVSGALADATVGVAYTSTAVNFTIADGSADFALGDAFDIEVVQQKIAGIAAYAIPNAGDQRAAVYTAGCFNIDAINWPASTTQAMVEKASLGTNFAFRKLLWSGQRVTVADSIVVGDGNEAPEVG